MYWTLDPKGTIKGAKNKGETRESPQSSKEGPIYIKQSDSTTTLPKPICSATTKPFKDPEKLDPETQNKNHLKGGPHTLINYVHISCPHAL